MAKGKHAAVAANNRYAAALEHLDRVTSELVDYKMRVRQVEADAARVPLLLKRISELDLHVANNTSDEVVRLRSRRDERMSAVYRENEQLRALFERVIDRIPGDVGVFTDEDLALIRDRRLAEAFNRDGDDRPTRRHRARGGYNTDRVVQDNRQTVEANLIRKHV